MKSAGRSRRAVWLKRMHTWHWISSAMALVGILFFSVTGLTLNHAERLESGQQSYQVVRKPVPAGLVTALKDDIRRNGEGDAGPSEPLRAYIREAFGIDTQGRSAEWREDEIRFSLERPGGDAWLKLDLARGSAEYHVSDAGWVAYFDDLHKGRHTGRAWAWFIDLLAVACVMFALTGLVILQLHAHHRPSTWPLVGLGLLLPFLIVVLLIH